MPEHSPATVFRLAAVSFDNNEDVRAITAIADPETQKIMTRLGAKFTALPSSWEVVLPVSEALGLFRACGKIRGCDPEHEWTSAIYDRLSRVVYRLIEDD